jgi:hypothetical protein
MFNDFDDDFDFEDFMNESEKEFESNLNEFREKMMAMAIEANYKSIKEKGLSDWHLRMMDLDELDALKITLKTMIDYFIEFEEYEKCVLLRTHLIRLEELVDIKSISDQDI